MSIQSNMFYNFYDYISLYKVICDTAIMHPVLLTLIIFGMCTYIGPSFHAFVIVLDLLVYGDILLRIGWTF